MSSTARKRVKRHASLAATASSALATVPMEPIIEKPGPDSRPAHVVTLGKSNSAPVKEVFEKLFLSLRGFAPEGELFIGQCQPLVQVCEVERATEAFKPLQGRSFTVRDGALAKLAAGEDTIVTLNSADLKKAVANLKFLPDGYCALFRFDLAGDCLAIVAYWSPNPIGQERIEAIKNIAELAGLAACASDLSLDVQAQQLHLETLRSEIEEVQQFYRQFSDAVRQCFWVLDVESGRVLVVSDNFERVWGASRRILTDGLTGFMASVSPADKDRVLSEFHTALGGELDTELRVVAEDGEVRWIWLRAFPTSDFGPAESATGAKRIVLIADDVTEKKMQEETIRAREAELVSRARMLAVGDLASGVAHEINNPLTVIVGKAAEIKQSLKKPNVNPETLFEYADKIQRTSIRISEIVLSLKSLSRPDRAPLQRMPFQKVFLDLRDICTERFKAHGVKLEIADFPPRFAVEMNATLVSQMLLNLMNNALDAVLKESDKWVKVEWAEDDDSAFIFVTDSGPGIPIKIRSRIFDPFFTTKEPGKGTGLGLSLAASIAAHHNGMLRLDTFHSHTRFVVQLPKQQPPGKAPKG